MINESGDFFRLQWHALLPHSIGNLTSHSSWSIPWYISCTFISIMYLSIYDIIYLEPVCPLFWGFNPPKQGLSTSFGFQVYVYIILYLSFFFEVISFKGSNHPPLASLLGLNLAGPECDLCATWHEQVVAPFECGGNLKVEGCFFFRFSIRDKLGSLGRVPDIYTNIYHMCIYGLYNGCIDFPLRFGGVVVFVEEMDWSTGFFDSGLFVKKWSDFSQEKRQNKWERISWIGDS